MKNQQAEEADTTDSATDNSDALELIKYQCTECGAEIITAKGTVATTCAYCGHAISISSKLVGDFKPDALIPFSIGKANAEKIYDIYCKKSLLAPKEFRKKENLKKMKGLYVPFWLHTFQDNAHAVVNCENHSSRKRGDDKVITKKMYNVTMNVVGKFDKIPTDALTSLDNSLMDAVEPFDYEHLKNFSPAYMAGFYAEEKNESAEDTFKRAHERAVESLKTSIVNNAGSYNLKRITNYDGKTTEYDSSYVMLPVWILSTEYKNKKYTFAINGDTGKITGKLPIDATKLCIILGSSVLGTQLLAMLFRLIEML